MKREYTEAHSEIEVTTFGSTEQKFLKVPYDGEIVLTTKVMHSWWFNDSYASKQMTVWKKQ